MSEFTDYMKKELVLAALPTWKLRPRILLQPPTPKPLHRVVPREILGKPWWDATRQAAYASTEYHCVACGVARAKAKAHGWLEGHEVYRINYRLGRMTYIETVPLCHYCHNYIHIGRLQRLAETRQIPKSRFTAIVQHGNAILRLHKLRKPVPPLDEAPWQQWHLVLFGEVYPTPYKNEAEWLRAMRGHAPDR